MANQDNTAAALRRRYLGWGIGCTDIADDPARGKDIVLTPSLIGARDIVLVEGLDNLSQALEIALLTPLGGDPFNIDFGFDGLNALVEETSAIMVQERVRVSLVTLLKKDRRVTRVVDVKLADGRLNRPTAGQLRELDVRVVFETLTADTAAINFGKVNLDG
jgi:phage baseplate assembly protein W